MFRDWKDGSEGCLGGVKAGQRDRFRDGFGGGTEE